ncbi:FadR/GntR family transcriptional regulator [Labrys sp. La1]|uniref:FadR/GntR family transcriptional regulator n=1 Tax=Labrys sp. La1 TaxID=3404917 RepID=UPI003EBEB92E
MTDMHEPAKSKAMEPFSATERGLPAQIAARLGRRIIQGELRPGDKLPKESDLLDQLQVSRTTLREALTLLSSKGFTEAKQRIGTTIRSAEFWNTLDPMVMSWHGAQDEHALAQELFEIRSAIEPLAAGLAAQRATADDLAQIRIALTTMAEDHKNPRLAMDADIAFHLGIIQAAHNRFLLPVASVIRAALTISVPKTFQKFGGMRHALALHEAIAVAIERRDAETASKAASDLIADTYERNFNRP